MLRFGPGSATLVSDSIHQSGEVAEETRTTIWTRRVPVHKVNIGICAGLGLALCRGQGLSAGLGIALPLRLSF